MLSLHLLKYHVKWYVSFQHFSYSIWSFLQKHDNVHFKAPQEDKKPIYLTKEYGLCQQNWQEIRCHCGTVVWSAALWTKKKSKKGRFFTHIQHYCTLAKKPAHILAQIILSILLGPASRRLISWMKQFWGNNWGWDTHTFYGQCTTMLDRAIKNDKHIFEIPASEKILFTRHGTYIR